MSENGQEIAIIIEFEVATENRGPFLSRLHENCQETLRDDGCLRMECRSRSAATAALFFSPNAGAIRPLSINIAPSRGTTPRMRASTRCLRASAWRNATS